ncbi:HD domain-containing protein [Pontibacter sp. H249]|uniref:HD domain-containing protein n=1 Tax=Pontibacter sp. H249 TaxID=3133420 RepID=UPI0030C07A51
MVKELKQNWDTLCSKYTADAYLTENLWQELEQAYTSEGRYYHNLNHLAYMLELAEKYKHESIKYDLLQFAIFYHDIVYTPTQTDNEEKSAQLAEEQLHQISLPEDEIAQVKSMILSTKNHQQNNNITTDFLLDLDLAILGAGWQKYNVYRQAIRKEYSMYSDATYQTGRQSILQRFLAQPYIFKTPFFRERLELQARENLRMELDMLR